MYEDLPSEEWEEFTNQYKSAEDWRIARSLAGQVRYLRKIAFPTQWQVDRLAELEKWQEVQTALERRDTTYFFRDGENHDAL